MEALQQFKEKIEQQAQSDERYIARLMAEARRSAKFKTHEMFVASRLKQIVMQADWRL